MKHYSANFKKQFALSFATYFSIIWGFLTIVLTAEPVLSEEIKYQANSMLGVRHTLGPKVITSQDQKPPQSAQEILEASKNPTPTPEPQPSSGGGFGSLLGSGSEIIVPASTDFGIVIEKINANAKVVADVDPGSEESYSKALAFGVAHAKGTSYPGEKGNTYLFSHSTDAPWNIIRYNAIFYLLSKLDKGDTVTLFYKGRRYDYIVYDKTIASSSDVHFLTDLYDAPVLTLQTCDPPGTLINRLVVRARMARS